MKKPIGLFSRPGTAGRLARALLIPAICLGFCTTAYAQTSVVTGTVFSDEGPLPGATVTVQGTTTGTSTDAAGNFSLQVSPESTLEIFYLGYRTEIVPVGSRTRFDIRLTADVNVLEQVVAIGYGVQKKALNTGATLNVSGENIAERNTLSPLQALQGQTPGMLITSTSGQPGEGMKVIIRGQGTIYGTGPLYIIDGIPGDVTKLNSSDIQSIDVLKDAASAAIYGSQAGNGVVLVTTRQGAKGKAQVNLDMYYGIQNVVRSMPMLNAAEYKVLMNEQAVNSGSAPIDFNSLGELADTDWVKQMFNKNAPMQYYNVGVSGGNEFSHYLLSLNYTAQEGIAGGKKVSNYERYGFRFNSGQKLFGDILTIGENINLTFTNNTGIGVGNQYNNTLRSAFQTSPLAPVYSDNNIYNSPYNDTSDSPYFNGDGNPYAQMMNNQSLGRAQNLFGNLYAELQPLAGLRIRTSFGLDYYSSNFRQYSPAHQFSPNARRDYSTVNQGAGSGHTITWINTAAYDFIVADHHSFSVLLGSEAIQNNGISVGSNNRDLLPQFDSWEYAYMNNTTGQAFVETDDQGKVTSITETKGGSGGPSDIYKRMSYFGRVSYNYKEKYLLNATLRYDGSSNYAAGHRWGWFPSVSAGWVVSNEPFMENLTGGNRVLDYLKLRASWGQVGNQNAQGPFQFASPINTSTNVSGGNPAAEYVFGTSKINVPGSYPLRLANSELGWETSQQANVGIDARFFRGRLDLVFDYYIKTTIDWMVTAPILATAGAQPPQINGGKVQNSGVELGFIWNDRQGDFRYSIGLNGSYNKNTVKDIPTEDGMIHGDVNMLYDNAEEAWRVENGHSIGYFWGYQTAGLFQNTNQINDHRTAGRGFLQPDPKPGDVIFVDQNNDGKINTADKIDLGNGIPSYNLGFNIDLAWRGIDLSVNGYGMFGHKLLQTYRNHTNKQSNYSKAALGRWTGEGTSNKFPRVTETNVNWQFSDLYLQKGDFLRISTITLGYDVAPLINANWLSKFRVYGQVQNAFTFTRYDGMDPEIGYGPQSWVSGVDVGYYPRPQIFMLGAQITF